MNLSQLSSFICTKVNQSETDDIAACKEFLKRRMEMIWNDELWKDSLVAFTQVLSPDDYAVTSTWLPEKGVLLCPTIIERVVAARLDSRKLNVQRQEFYYRFDYDSFAKNGSATEFVLLPPCVWEFETAQDLQLLRANDADSEATVTSDTLDDDRVGVTRNTTILTAEINDIDTTERVDSLSKTATTGQVTCGTESITYGSELCSGNYNGSGHSYVSLETGKTYLYVVGNSTSLEVAFTPVAAGEFVAEEPTADLSGIPGQSVTASLREKIVAVSNAITLAASATAAPLRQRIRLLEIPEVETTIRVLGKRTMPTFTSDLDTPPISGVMNCLLAFAQSDMLQRERQYGKAQAIAQEGMGLLEQLKRQEVIQQAHNVSIQPGQGFVSEYQFNSGGYSPLTF